MLKRYRDGDFQVMRFGQTADYDHPETFLEPFFAAHANNRTGFHDDRFEAAMARAAREADPAEGARLYREAERIALAATPRIPLYFYTRSTLVKPWVKGFWGSVKDPHAIDFLWIDPAWDRGGPNVPAHEPAAWPSPGRFSP